MPVRRYSFLATYFLAFFSPAVYRDVARNGRGVALGYLFLLVLATWLVTAPFWHVWVVDWTEANIPPIAAQMPELRYDNDRLSTPEDRPYEITYDDLLLALVDTTADGEAAKKSEAPLVFTRTELISGMPDNRDVQPLSRLFTNGDVVTAQDLETFARFFSHIIVWLALPFIIAIMYLFRVVQALVFSLIGLQANTIFGCGLNYAAVLRTTIVALSPVLVINAFVGLAIGYDEWWGLTFVLITMAYLFYAFGSVGRAEELDDTPPL